jgi:hypothetical protein
MADTVRSEITSWEKVARDTRLDPADPEFS